MWNQPSNIIIHIHYPLFLGLLPLLVWGMFLYVLYNFAVYLFIFRTFLVTWMLPKWWFFLGFYDFFIVIFCCWRDKSLGSLEYVRFELDLFVLSLVSWIKSLILGTWSNFSVFVNLFTGFLSWSSDFLFLGRSINLVYNFFFAKFMSDLLLAVSLEVDFLIDNWANQVRIIWVLVYFGFCFCGKGKPYCSTLDRLCFMAWCRHWTADNRVLRWLLQDLDVA